jgi:flavodoxin
MKQVKRLNQERTMDNFLSTKKDNYLKYKTYRVFILSILTMLCLIPTPLYAQQDGGGKTLILYYSLTGNTKACCESLQKALDTDILEIQDLVNRSGSWGFIRSAFGSMFSMHTDIEPETPDLSPYQNIILASPIWTGKLSMAIRTFIDKNKLDGKKVVLFTTTNAFEEEKYKEKSRNLVREAGGEVVGYYQVLAKEEINGEKVDRTKEQLVEDTLKFVPEIQEAFSLQKSSVPVSSITPQ